MNTEEQIRLAIRSEEFFAAHESLLSRLGWHINITGNSISLHSLFKNGNPRKGADVRLSFHEFSHDYIDVDSNGDLVDVLKKRARPWEVSSKKHGRKTFGSFEKAEKCFLEWAGAEHLSL